jgi:hypothetical protein
MEDDYTNFLPNKDYILKNNVKSISLYLSFIKEGIELLGNEYKYHKNGALKSIAGFGDNKKYAEYTSYNEKGQKIKKIEDFKNNRSRRDNRVDTTIFKYSNGLLVEEIEYRKYSDKPLDSDYSKEDLNFIKTYKYDNKKRIIEIFKHYSPFNRPPFKENVFEYPNSQFMKEFMYSNDDEISRITYHKYNEYGKIIEIKSINPPEDTNNKYQLYRHGYIYHNNGLIKETQSFDNENKLISYTKYLYDTNCLLKKMESYEQGQLNTIFRLEYTYNNFLNSLFR